MKKHHNTLYCMWLYNMTGLTQHVSRSFLRNSMVMCRSTMQNFVYSLSFLKIVLETNCCKCSQICLLFQVPSHKSPKDSIIPLSGTFLGWNNVPRTTFRLWSLRWKCTKVSNPRVKFIQWKHSYRWQMRDMRRTCRRWKKEHDKGFSRNQSAK